MPFYVKYLHIPGRVIKHRAHTIILFLIPRIVATAKVDEAKNRLIHAKKNCLFVNIKPIYLSESVTFLPSV